MWEGGRQLGLFVCLFIYVLVLIRENGRGRATQRERDSAGRSPGAGWVPAGVGGGGWGLYTVVPVPDPNLHTVLAWSHLLIVPRGKTPKLFVVKSTFKPKLMTPWCRKWGKQSLSLEFAPASTSRAGFPCASFPHVPKAVISL